MTRFTPILFIFFTLGTLSCFSQDTIAWKENVKLKWADFRGAPNPVAPYKAITSAGINYYFTVHKSRSFSFIVHSVFYKKKSWYVASSGPLLRHEQGHFDITEIFARRLRKAFQEYTLNSATIQNDLERIWEYMLSEKEKLSKQYDKESDFGENIAFQTSWVRKIASELTRLAPWAR